MKNLYLYIVILLLSVSNAFSQDPDNHWQLGVTDINFSTNPPAASTISNSGNYGNASICDANGNLLFYTDGIKVWNKNHSVMPHGEQISGTNSYSFQPAVIIPYPGNSNKYYIISSNGESFLGSSNSHYTYSIVDFTNNALGEVIPTPIYDSNNFNQYSRYLIYSNYPIYGNGKYKPLISAKKSNNSGYWAIIQTGKIILSYEITSAGLNETPVTSDFSSTVINASGIFKSMFRMNQDFSKLYGLEFTGTGNYGMLFYQVNFNSLTGAFSSFQKIDFASSIEKYNFFELSKDDNKAYFVRDPSLAGPNQPGEIVVLDLLNIANKRILAEYGNSSNLPNDFTFLQRDKYGDVLITSYSTTLNRNKYIHKIENSDSYTNAAIKLNWVSSNNNPIAYMPQLINGTPVSLCGNLTITTNVTSGQDNRQGATITASNVISSGAGAIYHAGNSVTFTNGFNAVAGSNFRGYIEGCTGVYVGKSSFESEYEMESPEKNNGVARLYPNPNDGNFTISLDKQIMGGVSVTVYNVYGKLVYKGVENQSTFNLNLPHLSSGLYVVKMEGYNYDETLKLIKH